MELVRIENVNGVLVTTSNRVAEELGVLHKDLLEKIDGYIAKFRSAEFSAGFYISSNYVHPQNKQTYRNYLITEKGVAQLIGGYSLAVEKAFALNVAYINKFEEMKKELNNQFKVPTSLKEALLIALEQQGKIETLEIESKIKDQQIGELKPKATYYDMVLQCKALLSINVIAKDYGKTAQWLNDKLREFEVQYKQGNIWLLYQKYATHGYTQTKLQPINRSTGPDVKAHTYWTQKGRLFIYELLKKNGYLPNIEREYEKKEINEK